MSRKRAAKLEVDKETVCARVESELRVSRERTAGPETELRIARKRAIVAEVDL